MLNELIAQQLEHGLQELLNASETARPEGLRIVIEHPANKEHGDYSTNMAMLLAKPLKRAPAAIAQELISKLQQQPAIRSLISRMEVAGPGFINLYVDWSRWAKQADELELHVGSSSDKVVIEHTSINPNKSAHIGHLRNSCIGDTLARLMRRTGYQVEVHNYIDDLGNQLADTVVGIHRTTIEGDFPRFGDFCWDVYAEVNKAYKEQPDLQLERTRVLHELEKGGSSIAWTGLLVAERIVKEHVEEMKQFGIGYDVLVWESNIVREGFWSSAFALLKETPVFVQETEGKLEGCWVLKQEEHHGEAAEFHAEKVLVRSNGILTYTAKDIAYHLWKFGLLDKDFRYQKFAEGLYTTDPKGRKKNLGRADTVINVIDHRQEYPQAMVKQALLALGYDKQAERLKHVSYGVVSLSRDTADSLGVDVSDGKHSYPMSGRQGIGVKIADFLAHMEQVIDSKRSRKAGLSSRAIAAAAVRYYLLRFHLQTEVVFDLAQATEISGNTGVYLLYSYARACSILAKMKEDTASRNNDEREGFAGLNEQESALLRQLAYWPETLDVAAKELAPNMICSYAHELATLFNHFYATCPIWKADSAKRDSRLWITSRFKDTLQDALQILGLPAPRTM
ncbi:arginine--tRNA ligase [Paenibacillus sp. NPDC056579]|uniref:arginine--tRNA ligase n=1 Tax=Paenibacillus sp. NPDC056579 TaxID=3345871 RepID=UPI0036965849